MPEPVKPYIMWYDMVWYGIYGVDIKSLSDMVTFLTHVMQIQKGYDAFARMKVVIRLYYYNIMHRQTQTHYLYRYNLTEI